MRPKDDHIWAMHRLSARRLGLLTDAQALKVEAHLESCASCREQVEMLDEESPQQDDGEHIPSAVLATWSRSQLELRGLERVLVRRHLQRCANCREDLELIGQPAVLPIDPELEPAPNEIPKDLRVVLDHEIDNAFVEPAMRPEEPRARASGVVETMQPAIAGVVEGARRTREWLIWSLGGWSAVATAAAVLLFLNPRGPTQGNGGIVLPSPEAVSTLQLERHEVRISKVTRGASQVSTGILPRSAAVLDFEMPEPPMESMDSSAQLRRIEILGPGNGILADIDSISVAQVKGLRKFSIVLHHPLIAGMYQVYVVADNTRWEWGAPIELRPSN